MSSMKKKKVVAPGGKVDQLKLGPQNCVRKQRDKLHKLVTVLEKTCEGGGNLG